MTCDLYSAAAECGYSAKYGSPVIKNLKDINIKIMNM